MLGAFVAGLVAAVPALRRADLGGAAAGIGVLLFVYWLLHSSLDWFWEFPGLTGPALLGLGVAMAVAGSRRSEAAAPASPDAAAVSAATYEAAEAGAGSRPLLSGAPPSRSQARARC